ncbi:MAG TPA: CPBP family glutamic-type intramembrane protease [Vicinamibacterales bacterium]|nr:CPBP family glutamic-type intramembrane protease [Vicinamibacterales bacterium]
MTTASSPRDHSLRNYFALVFLVSWGGILAVGGGLAAIPGPAAPTNPIFPLVYAAMLAGPVAAALVMTGIIEGSAGFRAIARRLLWRPIDAGFLAVAILTAPVAIAVSLVVLSLVSDGYRPGLQTGAGPGVVFGLLVGAGAGVLEELGWTGFATPRLRARWGILRTGLTLGCIWALWHVLAVLWGIGALNGSVPLGLFVAIDLLAILPVYRVLIVWLHDRSGSLSLAMLMHASLTASLIVLGPAVTGWRLLAYDAVVAAVLWIFAGVLLMRRPGL